MVYSLWNYDTLRYDYYRDDSGPKPGQPVLARAKYKGGDSVRPEDVLTILPEGALKIGSGEVAQGRIAVTKSEAALGQSISTQTRSSISWLAAAAAGYVLYRLWKKK